MTITDAVDKAVADAFNVGMFQHRSEILGFARFIANIRPRNVIEIGTLHGGTAALWHHLSTGKVITIDKPSGRFGGADHNLDLARCIDRSHRLTAAYPRIVPVLGDSKSNEVTTQVAEILNGEPVDLLFIDGDHTLQGVRDDYNLYQTLVPEGGVIAFHDIAHTELHTRDGVEVPEFFDDLAASGLTTRRWVEPGPWGGIGAVLR